MDWYESLPLFHQILWGVVVFFTTIWAVQAVMKLMGLGGAGADLDTDAPDGVDTMSDGGVDGGSLNLFETSNIILFFAAFGWVTLSGIWSGMADITAAILGFFVAAVLVVCVAWVWVKLYQLSSSGTMDLRNAIGAIGSVYFPIPPAGQGKGAIMVTVQGQRRELAAITKDASVTEPIPTGTEVRVVDVSDSGTLLVAPARVHYRGPAPTENAPSRNQEI